VALYSWIKYGTNSDFSLSLDPARYRERFCTKRFVGFKPLKIAFGTKPATPN